MIYFTLWKIDNWYDIIYSSTLTMNIKMSFIWMIPEPIIIDHQLVWWNQSSNMESQLIPNTTLHLWIKDSVKHNFAMLGALWTEGPCLGGTLIDMDQYLTNLPLQVLLKHFCNSNVSIAPQLGKYISRTKICFLFLGKYYTTWVSSNWNPLASSVKSWISLSYVRELDECWQIQILKTF
jgi:hypothetical protein